MANILVLGGSGFVSEALSLSADKIEDIKVQNEK